jgi:nicotinate phosphoribosyltransferase
VDSVDSLLDQDFYKLTMQQAVLELYPYSQAIYKFIPRKPVNYTRDMVDDFNMVLKRFGEVGMTANEKNFLKHHCPYLKPWYLEYLSTYRFNPDEVVAFHNGIDIDITVVGPWHRTILWEVPILATISEIYYHRNSKAVDAQEYHARTSLKGRTLADHGVVHFEFGTRRRRGYAMQRLVVDALKQARSTHGENTLFGVSNVHFAHTFGLRPAGTMAHEWIMAHSVLNGLRHANRNALEAWAKVYRGDLGIALTDTYGTKPFWQDFDLFLAKLFDGVRQDSGDPYAFVNEAIGHYRRLKIDPMSKIIIFSDALDVKKAVALNEYCSGKIRAAFGIGTHFTNDVPDSPALNIVMKLDKLDGESVVKLGEDVGKATGDPTALKIAMHTFHGAAISSL